MIRQRRFGTASCPASLLDIGRSTMSEDLDPNPTLQGTSGFPFTAATRIAPLAAKYRTREPFKHGGRNVPSQSMSRDCSSEMERGLAAEDPNSPLFAAWFVRSRPSRDHRRRRRGTGRYGLLLAGVSGPAFTPLGLVGFIVMLASVFLVVSAWHGPAKKAETEGPSAPGPSSASSPKPAKGQSGFMSRFEQRWQERNRRDGRES